jgi:uncharacterized protein YlaI
MKPLGEYTQYDLKRVFGEPIESVKCPECRAKINIPRNTQEASQKLKQHAATHSNPAEVENILTQKTFNIILKETTK